MEIVININATSAEDYRNAIKALMDGAGMVGFEIPNLPTETQPRDTKVQQQAEAEKLLRNQAAKAAQQPAVAAQEAASAKPVTLEDLQTTGRKLALAGKQDKLGEILGKYSVRKLSDIPSEHWAEALNEMEVSING